MRAGAFIAASYAPADSEDVKTKGQHLGAIFMCRTDAHRTTTNSLRGPTMPVIKSLGFAGALILSALLGGTLIGSALAQDDGTDTDTGGDAGAYCTTFMDAFASELGATRDEVVAAGKAAAGAALDAAVDAGDVSEERAASIRERIDAYEGEGCAFGAAFRLGFGHGLGHGEARGLLGGDVLEAAADALGIESADLIERLGDTESLEALAEEEGVAYDDVRAAVLAAVQADLDAAVAEGLDQERADATIERLTTWLDDGGQLDGFGGRRWGAHFGPGHGGFGPLPWTQDEDAESDGSES
jgi:hypothetical protein